MRSDNDSPAGSSPESMGSNGPRGDAAKAARRIQVTDDGAIQCAAFERVLADVAGRLSRVSDGQFDDAVTSCLQTLVEFLQFDRSTVMVFSEKGQRFRVSHSWSAEGVPVSSRDMPLNTEIPWFTHQIRSGHIVSVSNAIDLPIVAAKERAYLLESGLKSTLAVPLLVEGATIGAIGFGSFKTHRQWPGEMVTRLRLVGEIMALAIRQYQYAQGLKSIAQTIQHLSPGSAGAGAEQADEFRRRALRLMESENQERRRMGKVLHEDVMQILAAVGMIVQASGTAEPQQAESRAKAVSLLREALDKLRRLTLELRPDAINDMAMADGMRWLANQMRRRHELNVDVKVDAAIETVPENTRTFIYDSARKLLDNVAAHSGGRQARVELQRTGPGHIRLVVSDDGVGFNPAVVDDLARGTFGLFSIREQAQLLGGTLEVTSSVGKGTRAVVTVPLNE